MTRLPAGALLHKLRAMFPLRIFPLVCLFLVPGPHLLAADALAPEIAGIIQRAGSTSSDEERLELLRQLQGRQDLSPQMTNDLDVLLNNTVQKYVDSNKGKTTLFAFMKDFYLPESTYTKGVSEDSPLKPIEALYNGRAQFWAMLQSSPPRKHLDIRIRRAKEAFQAVHEAFPDNAIAPMYLGTPTGWPKTYADDPKAPEWANLQRRAIEGFADVIEWWVDYREFPDRDSKQGLYGGTPGDDCEMWRWWTPILLGFQDPKIEAAQERLSLFTLSSPNIKRGYYGPINDVEHSSEDFTDAVTPMMHLQPFSSKWNDRPKRVVELMLEKWTGINERGQMQFKSVALGSTGISEDPQHACETPYHTRVLQPVIISWLRTGDSEMGKTVLDWLDTWVAATNLAECGKPAGIVPAGIHWPDGQPKGPGPNWWKTDCWKPELSLSRYNFPTALYLLCDALLAAWQVTGDSKYLEPIKSMAKVMADYRTAENAEPGSIEWCGSKLWADVSMAQQPNLGFMMSVEKYTVLTGDKTFEPLLVENGGYGAFRTTGNIDYLTKALRKTSDQLSRNFEVYTGEVRWTDRVLRMPPQWFSEVAPEFGQMPDAGIIFNSVTGNVGAPYVFPTNAVKWLTPPREIAALVLASDAHRLSAELYHFGETSRKMGANFFLLKGGAYEFTLKEKTSGKILVQRTLVKDKPELQVEFEVPSRSLCALEVTAK